MTIQHILTLSIDAIALAFAAMMAADFVLRLLEKWSLLAPKSQGICAEILEPIFEEAAKSGGTNPHQSEKCPSNTSSLAVIADPWILPTEAHEMPNTLLSSHWCKKAPRLLLLPEARPQNNLIQLNIRQLKKQASAAKIRNYNVMTKSQLIEALSA